MRQSRARACLAHFPIRYCLRTWNWGRRGCKGCVMEKVFRGSELQLRHNQRRPAPSSRGAFSASLLAAEGRFGQQDMEVPMSVKVTERGLKRREFLSSALALSGMAAAASLLSPCSAWGAVAHQSL